MKQHRVSYAMISPFFLLFVVFTVIPVLAAIYTSLTAFDMFRMDRLFSYDLSNYTRMVEDTVLLKAMQNTLVFLIFTGPFGFVFAFLMAWLINEMPRRVRVFLTVLFYAPSVSGNAFFVFTYFFSGDQYGILNGMLMRMGAIVEPILWFSNTDYNLIVCVIIQIWMSLGIGFIAFIAGFQSIDESQYEAGTMDGVHNRFQELWYITVPNMKNMLLFAAVIQIANSWSVGAVTAALTGGHTSIGYSTTTLINLITDYASVRYEMGYACALGVLLFVLVVLSKKIIFRLLRF
jgi:multiple sugar transport system permease protein